MALSEKLIGTDIADDQAVEGISITLFETIPIGTIYELQEPFLEDSYCAYKGTRYQKYASDRAYMLSFIPSKQTWVQEGNTTVNPNQRIKVINRLV